MKVAILSESPADEAAVRILLEGLLGLPVEVLTLRTRAGGWTSVPTTVPAVLKQLHYHRAAAALVVVVDGDNSDVHTADHERADRSPTNCRLCQLQSIIDETRKQLKPIPGHGPVEAAVAVAVPSIEAWYLCGLQPECSEAGWLVARQSGKSAPNESRRLKQIVYGTDRPGIQIQTAVAVRHAERLRSNLGLLDQWFPNTYGRFAATVRSWVAR